MVKAKKKVVSGIFLLMFFTVVFMGPSVEASAGQGVGGFVEQTVGELKETVTDKAGTTLKEGGTKIKDMVAAGLGKAVSAVPYAGIIAFLVGIFIAVFSTRNKGNRRYGLKLAVAAVVISYILYVALTLIGDYICHDGPVRFASRPERESFYEKAYYDTVEELGKENQGFLFLGKGWISDMLAACRKVYISIADLLVYVSISTGVLLLFITKRDKAIRRFALGGLCIVSPVTLMAGYLFLRM